MLSPMQRAMIAVLRDGPVRTTSLIDTLYGDREDGGPECAYTSVRVQIHKMRARLSACGIEIETVGEGRGTAGYRVRPEHRDALDRLLNGGAVTVSESEAA